MSWTVDRRWSASCRSRGGEGRTSGGERQEKCFGRGLCLGLSVNTALLMREGHEKVVAPAGRLCSPEEEVASLLQGVVKEGNALLLGGLFEVDEEIAADDKVHPGKGRIDKEVVLGEYDVLPYLLADGDKVPPRLGEELAHVLGRHVGRDGCGIDALPGLIEGLIVEVRGKDSVSPSSVRRDSISR